MRNKFHGYYPLTPGAIKALWHDCIFVFDASVLLGMYIYSESIRTKFFDVLNSLQERLWIPHQVGLEYHRNRLNKIAEGEKQFDVLKTELDKVTKQLKSKRQHPFLSDELISRVLEDFGIVQNECKAGKQKQNNLISHDPIRDQILRLFDGRVGDSFTPKEIARIEKEGKDRYERGIPPGFEDARKPEGRAYGDLIIWKEMIRKAELDKRPIIYVTDDVKQDWWRTEHGKKVGPRPELRQEFRQITNQEFHLYVTDRFLEQAGKYVKQDVADAVQEIKESRKEAIAAAKTFDDYMGLGLTRTEFNKLMEGATEGHITLSVPEFIRRVAEIRAASTPQSEIPFHPHDFGEPPFPPDHYEPDEPPEFDPDDFEPPDPDDFDPPPDPEDFEPPDQDDFDPPPDPDDFEPPDPDDFVPPPDPEDFEPPEPPDPDDYDPPEPPHGI